MRERLAFAVAVAVSVSLYAQPPSHPAEKKWIPADPKVACVDAKDASLCAELLAIRDRDQIARYDMLNHPDDPSINAKVGAVDKENLAAVERIIEVRGWPGKSLVGQKASGAAWTVIQHADLPTQEKYIDMMTRAADAGELSWGLLATTIDRIRVREGKPQVYGTQFKNGGMEPEPIEDPEHVDERRAKVGLSTMAEYTRQMHEMYAKPAPKP